ncbi:hypothetical protein [Kineococcus esterisolvens]|uniref:hypothetical protein n=1 Tax=unclassified Kineococcus TaxID=2621656 RepID=UPI003D7E6388
MAIVSFLSAKGSPGATTAALLVAALWPRDVLVLDADPAGGDVAARLPGAAGGVLDAERGLLPLLTSARRGLGPQQLLDGAQPAAGGTAVVCGLTRPEQAGAAAGSWPALASAAAGLGATGTDVVVDAGRVTTEPVHLSLLRASDVVVLVLRDDVASVLHARERLAALGTVLRRADGLLPRTGVLVVGDPRRGDGDQAAEVVRAAGDRVEDFGRLPMDTAGARVFDGARTARPERTALVRAGRGVVAALAAAAAGYHREAA